MSIMYTQNVIIIMVILDTLEAMLKYYLNWGKLRKIAQESNYMLWN